MSEFALISLILLTLLGLAFYGFIAERMHRSEYRFRKDPDLKADNSFNDEVLGASGILIVGSSVGLVVSLQNELIGIPIFRHHGFY